MEIRRIRLRNGDELHFTGFDGSDGCGLHLAIYGPKRKKASIILDPCESAEVTAAMAYVFRELAEARHGN